MSSKRWSGERVALLKRLWGEGKTAAAIGARLGGLSRAAVLGKVFRLRLKPAASATMAQKEASAAVVQRRKGRPQPRAKAAPKIAAAPVMMPGKTSGKSLLELTNTSCRWLGN